MTETPSAAPSEDRPSPLAAGIAYGLGAALIWGTFIAFSRAGLSQSALHTPDIAFLRASIAGLVCLPWFIANRKRCMAELSAGRLVIYSLLVGPPFILVGISGFYFAPLAHGAVFLPGTLTIMGVLVAHFVLHEPQARLRFISVAIIAIGFLIIAAPGFVAGNPKILIGEALFFTAGTFWAVFSVLLKRHGTEPIVAVTSLSVFSMVVYCPLYLVFAGPAIFHEVPVSTLAVQGLIQGLFTGVLAILFYSLSVKKLGAGPAAVFPALVPVAGLLVGIPLTGEWLAPNEWVAVAIIGFGLALSVWGLRRG